MSSSPVVEYVLYKAPIQLETLCVVQYLYALGIDLRPTSVVERNHSVRATALPAVHEVAIDEWHVGLDACVRFYEARSGLGDLARLAARFKDEHPDFRIART